MIFSLFKRNYKIKPVVLVIMDGYGLAPPSRGNAIDAARTPNLDRYLKIYPHGELIASGESVGLPLSEVGNTEVGHLTIGAGRIIPQDLMRINNAIANGTFFDNRAFIDAADRAKSNGGAVHVMGCVSSGNVHASWEHIKSILQFCKKEGVENIYLHVFTDGRDAPLNEAGELLSNIDKELKLLNLAQIASVIGRYWAMDRDKRWDRTEKAYDVLTSGQGLVTDSVISAIRTSYSKGVSDEFIEPTLIKGKDGLVHTIRDNDSVIFANFRIDRAKQLTMSFVMPNFNFFVRKKVLNNLFFVTMTEYQKDIGVSAVAFRSDEIPNPLNVVLSQAKMRQIHAAESEKERFVTYYFDGLRETKVEGEEVKIVPSPKVPTYDKKPKMSLPKLVKVLKHELSRDVYNFAVVNFANPDMVAHSGNLNATIVAIRTVDQYLNEIIKQVDKQGGITIITADHGNAEELLTYPTTSYFFTSAKGIVNTDHSNNPVPVIFCSKTFEGKAKTLEAGTLADVAPTILALMGLPKPAEMTGRNLLL